MKITDSYVAFKEVMESMTPVIMMVSHQGELTREELDKLSEDGAHFTRALSGKVAPMIGRNISVEVHSPDNTVASAIMRLSGPDGSEGVLKYSDVFEKSQCLVNMFASDDAPDSGLVATLCPEALMKGSREGFLERTTQIPGLDMGEVTAYLIFTIATAGQVPTNALGYTFEELSLRLIPVPVLSRVFVKGMLASSATFLMDTLNDLLEGSKTGPEITEDVKSMAVGLREIVGRATGDLMSDVVSVPQVDHIAGPVDASKLSKEDFDAIKKFDQDAAKAYGSVAVMSAPRSLQ
jgi:hypothetical protein